MFFKIDTETAFDNTDSTIAVIIDDVSLNSGTYETACTTHKQTSSGNSRGYVFNWDTEGFWDRAHGSGPDWDDHVAINSGHNGVKLACDKDDLGFT